MKIFQAVIVSFLLINCSFEASQIRALDQEMIQSWARSFRNGLLNVAEKPLMSLKNAQAGIEKYKLQTTYADLYQAIKEEIDRQEGRLKPITPVQPVPVDPAEIQYITGMMIQSVPTDQFLQGVYDLNNYDNATLSAMYSLLKNIENQRQWAPKKADIQLLIGVSDQVFEARRNGEPVHKGPRLQLPQPQPQPRPVTPTVGFADLEKWDSRLRQGWKINLSQEPQELLEALITFVDNKGPQVQQEYNNLYNLMKQELARRGIGSLPRERKPDVGQIIVPTRTVVHLIDINRLQELGLCPLFQTLDDDILAAFPGINRNVPCTKSISANRQAIQLNTINQFELTQFGYATCPVQSLRSISLVLQYAETGNTQFLRDLNTEQNAQQFVYSMMQQGFQTNWLDRDFLEKVKNEAKINGITNKAMVSVIDNVLELDPRAAGISIGEEDTARVKNIKKIVQDGLTKDNFMHGFVIGSSDEAILQGVEPRVHFFAIILIKKGTEIQYVIVDTAPAAYHLSGYNFERLKYFIDLIERGKATTSFARKVFGS